MILCYHTKHLKQVHWNENFCRLYRLAKILSVARLNICQILIRWVDYFCYALCTIVVLSSFLMGASLCTANLKNIVFFGPWNLAFKMWIWDWFLRKLSLHSTCTPILVLTRHGIFFSFSVTSFTDKNTLKSTQMYDKF